MLVAEMPEEIKGQIPEKALPVLVEMIIKHGDGGGDLPDLEEISRKDPELMDRFIEALGPEMLNEFLDDLLEAGLDDPPGRRQKTKKT
ncbi:MAG: hypothetical protein U5R49_08070 [Deltaproteobacteria bacterium]|nr:hypothetical protein [Deltaproteobacteria bacterium]